MKKESDGHRFYIPGQPNGEAVFLVHGLMMASWIMAPLARKLCALGYAAVSYDYPTMAKNTAAHGDDFAAFLHRKDFYSYTRFHFVTHSMGGLVLRAALPKLSGDIRVKLGRTVMIVPPNRGSDMAVLAKKIIPFASGICACLNDLCSTPDSFANTFPEPPEELDIAVLAAAHDLEVKPDSAHLRHERAHLVLNSSHTLILFRADTAEQVGSYIRYGKFKEK